MGGAGNAVNMVLRCITTSTTMQKGHKGLKSVFWRKFRKRKDSTAAGGLTKPKKRTKSGNEVIAKDLKITPTPPPSTALIEVSQLKLACCNLI